MPTDLPLHPDVRSLYGGSLRPPPGSLFSRAKKDVLYDFLKREDIHWRKLSLHTARELYRQHALHHSQVRAYVLDDSIKARRGKKMEDVSSHYDHTTSWP